LLSFIEFEKGRDIVFKSDSLAFVDLKSKAAGILGTQQACMIATARKLRSERACSE